MNPNEFGIRRASNYWPHDVLVDVMIDYSILAVWFLSRSKMGCILRNSPSDKRLSQAKGPRRPVANESDAPVLVRAREFECWSRIA